jgi:UV radiation resistance-associated gene protein
MANITGDVAPPSKSTSKASSQSSYTIMGLRLMALPAKKTGYFSDKKEVQQSATALGYAAHVS